MPHKFNTVMEQSTDSALCMMIDQPISQEGYEQNFLPHIQQMLEQKGEIRLLVYYKDFKGWMEDATSSDMDATLKYGKKLKKVALVNPPKREIFQKKIKQPMLAGDMKIFKEEELDEAIEWVKT